MKRFALYSVPVLGALVFVAACTDATSPGDGHSKLRPAKPTPALLGNVPPPPTRTAVTIDASVSGSGLAAFSTSLATSCPSVFGAFEGVYFANGRSIEATAASMELADAALGFEGTAWLRIDNKQNPLFATTASANARFQVTDQKTTGKGTLTFFNGLCTLVINDVTVFIANPACTAAGEVCAHIEFTGTLNGQPATGRATAFDREVCDTIVVDEGGTEVFSCPEEGGGSGIG